MTESKVETPFDKGARILNAVIAEVDISADLKGNAQSVISMLAELLPRLLAQPAAGPTTHAPSSTSAQAHINGDTDADDRAIFAALKGHLEDVDVPRQSRAKSAPHAARRGRPRAHDAATSAQEPLTAPKEVSEADVKMVWNAYEMVQGLQRSHLEQLSPAIVAALRARVAPACVVERLISASSGAAQLWKAALDDLAKA